MPSASPSAFCLSCIVKTHVTGLRRKYRCCGRSGRCLWFGRCPESAVDAGRVAGGDCQPGVRRGPSHLVCACVRPRHGAECGPAMMQFSSRPPRFLPDCRWLRDGRRNDFASTAALHPSSEQPMRRTEAAYSASGSNSAARSFSPNFSSAASSLPRMPSARAAFFSCSATMRSSMLPATMSL